MMLCTQFVLGMAVCLVAAAHNRFANLDKDPYPIDCQQPLPRLCALDYAPHCLKGRKEAVFGHCEYQDAVCDEGAKFDPSYSCDLH